MAPFLEEPTSPIQISSGLRGSQTTEMEMGTCFFPLLTDGYTDDEDILNQKLQQLTPIDLGALRNARRLHSFCEDHGISTAALFNTVWALVLGCYLATENVGFLAVSSLNGSLNGFACRFELDKTKELGDILKDVQSETVKGSGSRNFWYLQGEQPIFNSAVVVQDVQSATHKEILQELNHQVGLVRRLSRWSIY